MWPCNCLACVCCAARTCQQQQCWMALLWLAAMKACNGRLSGKGSRSSYGFEQKGGIQGLACKAACLTGFLMRSAYWSRELISPKPYSVLQTYNSWLQATGDQRQERTVAEISGTSAEENLQHDTCKRHTCRFSSRQAGHLALWQSCAWRPQ